MRDSLASIPFTFRSDRFWLTQFGGSASVHPWDSGIDASGNVYITGYVANGPFGAVDIVVTKFTAQGVLVWQRAFGGVQNDYARGLTVTPAGDVYVAAQSSSVYLGNHDGVLAKFDAAGNLQWSRTLGEPLVDVYRRIALDGEGNLVVIGQTDNTGGASTDFLIVKYNSAGGALWQRRFGGSDADIGNDIAIDAANNIYVVGETAAGPAGSRDGVIAKISSDGNLLWARALGTSGVDVFTGVVAHGETVYIAGYSPQGAGGADAILVAMDTSGGVLWLRTLGGSSDDFGNAVAINARGQVVLASRVNAAADGGATGLATFDAAGNALNQWTLGRSGLDAVRSLRSGPQGDLVLVSLVTDAGTLTAGAADEALVARLPLDGIGVGSYGPYTYATEGLVSGAGSLSADPLSSMALVTRAYPTGGTGFVEQTTTYPASVYP